MSCARGLRFVLTEVTSRYFVGALVLALSMAAPALADAQGTLTGRIVEAETQRALSGVQVSIPASGLGTVTNNEGRYLIAGVSAGQVALRVQMLGYGTQERTVSVTSGQSTVADFQLQTEALGLDELVVTGTAGGQTRRAIGNVVGSLAVEETLEQTAPASVQQMLSGQVAGVNVQIGGGNVGSGGNIVIRGMNTVALGSGPLVYVDGIRVNGGTANSPIGQSASSRLNDISPENIERIEIIKGPAAATLYGTEAANGVIQIITKKGTPGEPSIQVLVRQGANWFHDAAGRIPLNHYLRPDGTVISQNLIQQEEKAGRPMFRTGYIQSYGVNLRGGSDRLTYYLSANHDDEEGYQFNNALARTNLRSNLQLQAHEDLDVNFDLGVIRSDADWVDDGGGNSAPMRMILRGLPQLIDTHTRGFPVGPPEVFRDIEAREDLNRATVSSTLTHRPASWLTQRLIAGFDFTDANLSEFTPRLPEGSPRYYGSNSVGNKEFVHRRDLQQTVDYNATASFDVTPAFTSATSVGVQYFTRESLEATAEGNNMPTSAVSTVSAASIRSAAETFVENKTFGVFVQETVGWQNQAFVTAALRADANSAFGESFEAAYYPKLSGTWVVSDADFWNVPLVNSFRVRAAWGKSGLQPDAFASIRTYSPTTGPNDLPTVTPGNIGNPDLKPEVGEELEIGFDASLLQDRVNLELTHYRQRTTDMIVEELVAPSLGFAGERFVNIGEVSNLGYELRLEATPILTNSVVLSLSATAAHNRNRLEDLGGRTVQADTRGRWQHVEGYELASMWTKYIATAAYGPNNQLINVTCRGPEEEDFRPMPCSEAPFHYFGNPEPSLTGSLGQTLNLGNSLTFNASWVYVYDSWRYSTDEWARENTLQSTEKAILRLQGELDPVEAASFVTSDVEHQFFERDDFLRLREISATYSVPDRFVQRMGVSRASLTLSGRNLFTLTHPSFRLLDPETKATNRNQPWPYWQQARSPTPHSIVTALRVTF